MRLTRKPIAAALCCMALAASPFALAAGDQSSATRSGSSGMSGSQYGAATQDSQTVREVQQALAAKGHNPGPIDGVMGPRTRAALKDYQQKNNLTSASGLDQQTLESLGVQASASGSTGRMGSGSSDSGSSAGASGTTSGGSGGMSSGRSDSGSSAGGSGTRSGGSGGAMGSSSVPEPKGSSSADQGTASDGGATSRYPTPESRASGSGGSSGGTAANPSPSGSNASQGTASDGGPTSSNPSGGASRDSGSSAGGSGTSSGGTGGSR